MQLDLRKYHSLLQAFDETGRRIFGEAWTGREAFARPTEDPQPFKEERRNLQMQIAEMESEAQKLAPLMRAEYDSDLLEETSQKLSEFDRKIRTLTDRLADIPNVSEAHFTDFDAFQRFEKVRSELQGAFETGKLNILAGSHMLVDWKQWKRLAGFRVVYHLSMVRVPFEFSNPCKRAPASILKEDLELWLTRFGMPNEESVVLTPEEAGKAELQKLIAEHSVKNWSRIDYQEAVLRAVPTLSQRSFDRIWVAVAPPNMRKAGRKKSLH
ncbi:MAG: hypothetical protein AB8B94_18065 [Hyphomicrobiales bacterium]